ncbi:MAG: protein jag [Clostridia bacterium]|nr:protein jag [Clostridia bacterium]
MLKSIETQGATRDDAIAAALAQLDLDRDSVSVEVLDNGKKGFLGIGATPARVRVTYEVPDAAPVKKPAPPAPARPAASVEPPVKPAAQPVCESAPAPRAAREEDDAPRAPYVPGTPLAEHAISQIGRDAVHFVDGLLEKLGVEGHAVVLDSTTEDTVMIEIVGPDMGPVIGRRGDTLDAIQYLTSLVANRDRDDHTRITIDTENYRAKREESLQRLAQKMANKVLKYHKNMTLEPMNPYERRIIHAALQDVRGVTTYSTGTEPGRRVVIAPEGRPAGGRGGYAPRHRDDRAR